MCWWASSAESDEDDATESLLPDTVAPAGTMVKVSIFTVLLYIIKLV